MHLSIKHNLITLHSWARLWVLCGNINGEFTMKYREAGTFPMQKHYQRSLHQIRSACNLVKVKGQRRLYDRLDFHGVSPPLPSFGLPQTCHNMPQTDKKHHDIKTQSLHVSSILFFPSLQKKYLPTILPSLDNTTCCLQLNGN